MTQSIDITVAGLPPAASETLVLYATEAGPMAGASADIWGRTGLDWQAVVEAAGPAGAGKRTIDLLLPPKLGVRRLLVLDAGDVEKRDGLIGWAERGGALVARLGAARQVSVVLDEPEANPAAIAEFAAGMRLRHYRFDKYKAVKAKEGEPEGPLSVTLHVADPEAVRAAFAERMAVVEGTLLARTLVNEPPNVLGPAEFAETAGRLAELGVDVEVLDAGDMETLGMAALLAVARGSARPPRLVVMQWNGAGDDSAPVAFVGKGVVFDTGGISIKPGNSMEDMKGDMGGAAAVTGLMHAFAARTARVNAVGVVGLVENMPDGNAYRPGDILRTMSGRTVEIVNTDAEGRLVLADALWYTKERFKPKAMVDLATLTGAIITALGHEHAGLFSNDDGLAESLHQAGLASGEKVWRMPLAPAYEKQIESRFADIKNTGGRPAGSATAAHFLKHFVGEVAWAHLDIAGTAFGGGQSDTNASWATGFGVALLDRLVRDRYER